MESDSILRTKIKSMKLGTFPVEGVNKESLTLLMDLACKSCVEESTSMSRKRKQVMEATEDNTLWVSVFPI